jgi:methionine synthase I (cobalamin-dependent)
MKFSDTKEKRIVRMTDDRIDKVLGSGKLLILDGAMGTMIQSYHLTEDDFRGDRLSQGRCKVIMISLY